VIQRLLLNNEVVTEDGVQYTPCACHSQIGNFSASPSVGAKNIFDIPRCDMFIDREPLPFIKEYITLLNQRLSLLGHGLTRIQSLWLGFCLMGILLTNSICWKRFEKMSLKNYGASAIRWMFCRSRIAWNDLLTASTMMIVDRYNIKEGVLVIDDKNIDRSKNTSRIYGVHKVKDKKTGGYSMAQSLVFLYFVTKKFCLPVGFAFYTPDPSWSRWKVEDTRLKKSGIAKAYRPKEPPRNWKKKHELALDLMKTFSQHISNVHIVGVLADALYGHSAFIDGVVRLWPQAQVISQLRKNQKICTAKKQMSCEEYFSSYQGWEQKITIRGRKVKMVLAGGGRLYVPSHDQTRWVIGLKYKDEKEYRYLVAANLSWNMLQVMNNYSLRWLIEVFLEDWSSYGGFCSLAKQRGVEGSERPLILSLLFDHCFLFHPEQTSSIEKQASLATFGSLVERSRMESFINFVRCLLKEEHPKETFENLVKNVNNIFVLRPSEKHLSGVEIEFGSSYTKLETRHRNIA